VLIGEKKKALDFGIFGIIIGILVAIFLIVLVTMLSLSHDDKSGEGVTWVG